MIMCMQSKKASIGKKSIKIKATAVSHKFDWHFMYNKGKDILNVENDFSINLYPFRSLQNDGKLHID